MGIEHSQAVGGTMNWNETQLMPRIIPCLDVKDGRVVKGIKFQNLRDAGDPAELAARYEQDGADELVMLDVSATVEGRTAMKKTIRDVRKQLSIPLTVGGGVKKPEDAAELLNAGADKVGVNTAAVERPELLREISERFGAQCTVLAIDAVGQELAPSGGPGKRWIVVTRSGTARQELDVIEWAKAAVNLGAGEILLTSWDRDGTRSGYDLELLKTASSAVSVPIIASGGASGVSDLRDALEAGAHAVLAASIFHDQDSSVKRVKSELANLGVNVRL